MGNVSAAHTGHGSRYCRVMRMVMRVVMRMVMRMVMQAVMRLVVCMHIGVIMRMIVAVRMVMLVVMVMVMVQQSGLQIGVEVGLFYQLPDLLLQQRQFGRIENFNLIILVNELCQLGQGAIGIGRRHRWCQMVDHDSVGAPLGLGTFARVIDDERVKQGQIAQQRIRETLLR